MNDPNKRTRLLGHRPVHPAGAAKSGGLPADARLRVTLILRPDYQPHKAWVHGKRRLQAEAPPLHRPFMAKHELRRLNAPARSHVAQVESFAESFGLQVLEVSEARHDVVLEGTASQLERAFDVELLQYEHEGGSYHGHEGDIAVPHELAGVVVAVLGLDGTPLRRLTVLGSATRAPISPLALADHYSFPPYLDGTGERIAVVALGGGYYEEDLAQYFESLGIARPSVRAVSVDGAKNQPLERERLREVVTEYNDLGNGMQDLWKRFGKDFADTIVTAETTMDVQVAGAMANGAQIDVYFAPNTSAGLYHAIYAAAGLGHDPMHEDGGEHQVEPATVLSLSWGWPESTITGSAAVSTETALQHAQAVGMCLCCASGDAGSLGEEGQKAASVLYPASSAFVLACGGTEFGGTGEDLSRELVWNADNRGVRQATGGGVSGAIPIPPWQCQEHVPTHGELNGAAWINPSTPEPNRPFFRGRGVPDVSAYADQIPGYALVLAGEPTSAGGTSAATPLWAGLIARLCQGLEHPLPWFNEVVYHPLVRQSFRSVPGGSNRVGSGPAAYFEATPGWNGCCGLGVPDGTELFKNLLRIQPPPTE